MTSPALSPQQWAPDARCAEMMQEGMEVKKRVGMQALYYCLPAGCSSTHTLQPALMLPPPPAQIFTVKQVSDFVLTATEKNISSQL